MTHRPTPPPSPRPPLDRDRLAPGSARLDRLRLVIVEETPSTNALAAGLAREGAADGTCLVAEHQSAGRGRLDRSWETPRGTSLALSLVVRPDLPPASWPWLPLLAGGAVAGALTGEGFEAGVKWPNDVLLGDRKVAGILVERVETSGGAAAVVGIGINVAMTAAELPVPTATSLELERGGPVDRTGLLLEVLTALRGTYDEWSPVLGRDPRGAERLAAAYGASCVTVGREVRVDLPDGGELLGLAVGIDTGGRLEVRTDDGRRVAVAAGDVVHVRPRPAGAEAGSTG